MAKYIIKRELIGSSYWYWAYNASGERIIGASASTKKGCIRALKQTIAAQAKEKQAEEKGEWEIEL